MPEMEWRERLNEIEELHRAILARMDQSEQRAAAREKERAERRTAQEARVCLGAHEDEEAAKLDTSSEAMRATTKRWLETMDRFFQVLESKLQNKRADDLNG